MSTDERERAGTPAGTRSGTQGLEHIERWLRQQTGEPPWRATWRKYAARRRAAKAAAGPMTMTRDEIGSRDGWVCAWTHIGQCLAPSPIIDHELDGNQRFGPTIEHLLPLRDGGTNEPDNLGVSHRLCNVTHKGWVAV